MLKKVFIKNKFLNRITFKGQKQSSERELLKCFKTLQKSQLKKDSKELFKISLINSSPFFQLKEIKSKKNKKSIEIPFLLSTESKLFYGMKNIIKSASVMENLPFYEKLKLEFIKTSSLKGSTISKKKALHESAFVKKKYARYRWF